MKIITNNMMYVQQNDLYCLYFYNIPMPEVVQKKIISKNYNDIISMSIIKKNKFVACNDADVIEYFKNIDWIVDYNQVKDLSAEEIIELRKSITQEINKKEDKFFTLPPDERNLNMLFQCQLLYLKNNSLNQLLLFKQGKIKIKLPEDIDYPDDMVSKNSIKRLIKK